MSPIYLCLYVYHPVVDRQRLGKNFSIAKNTQAKIQYLCDAFFSMLSMSNQKKVGYWFLPQSLIKWYFYIIFRPYKVIINKIQLRNVGTLQLFIVYCSNTWLKLVPVVVGFRSNVLFFILFSWNFVFLAFRGFLVACEALLWCRAVVLCFRSLFRTTWCCVARNNLAEI
jgi:hypothetical protein